MEIIRIKEDSLPECFEKLSALDKLCVGADGWSAQSFREEAQRPESIILAACDGDTLAGMIAGFTAADTGEILTVGTATGYRRKGVARMLMEAFFAALPPEVENIALEVRESNTAAIGLYRSFGFAQAGIRKRFYRDPVEDAYIMVRDMTGNKEGR